jgi:hypothetical protein
MALYNLTNWVKSIIFIIKVIVVMIYTGLENTLHDGDYHYDRHPLENR